MNYQHYHEVTVKELRELLAQLDDDDMLFPNLVQNLGIVRDGVQIGYVDLGARKSVEFWGGPEEEP